MDAALRSVRVAPGSEQRRARRHVMASRTPLGARAVARRTPRSVRDPLPPQGFDRGIGATMESEFLDALHRDLDAGDGSGSRLVQACRDATDVTGAGIMLMADGQHRGTVGASDAAIAVVEEL